MHSGVPRGSPTSRRPRRGAVDGSGWSDRSHPTWHARATSHRSAPRMPLPKRRSAAGPGTSHIPQLYITAIIGGSGVEKARRPATGEPCSDPVQRYRETARPRRGMRRSELHELKPPRTYPGNRRTLGPVPIAALPERARDRHGSIDRKLDRGTHPGQPQEPPTALDIRSRPAANDLLAGTTPQGAISSR